MKQIELRSVLKNNDLSYLEKKYFYISPFRKVKYQLILDIITARIEELFEICYQKNINIKNLKSNDKVYIYVESSEYYANIQYVMENSKLVPLDSIYNNNTLQSLLAGVNGACELISKGWEKEAIPISHKKKSLISLFFSRLFS